jgi:glucose/mannose-6-phosphate isomerase
MTLDDLSRLASVDPHGARHALSTFPEQCRRAATLTPSPPAALPRPRAVLIAGMGGSASGGDLLAACAVDRLDVPVVVHRGYGLPGFVGTHDLVIATSYSGDTEETLSAAATALDRGARLVAVTSGGRLAALVAARRLPSVALPPDLMPRMALGYLLFPLVAVLRAADLAVVKNGEIDETLHVLEAMAAELRPENPTAGNEAKRVALALGDRMPVVYGGAVTGAVAYRWKTDLEENGKTLAISGALPEMNHNEIEAWRNPATARLHLVLLRDDGEPAPIARRFAFLRELTTPIAGGITEVHARGTSHLARVLSLAYLGQWVSYYVAISRGVDPWVVPTLDALKAHLRTASR